MSGEEVDNEEEERGSSPAARGGAGVYIEGELGAFYLLAMLARSEPRGLKNTRIERVRFQGVELGYALDDLIVHASNAAGESLLEIQSKRTITFAPKDPVFREVCAQIATSTNASCPEERHFLGVATQRTSNAISGAYQDVLQWADMAGTSADFFRRLSAKGVASKSMRDFVATFRANLVAEGVDENDDAIWRILRRFLILEFDFESSSPVARTLGLVLAGQVLSDEDTPRAGALWSTLIEISIATSKAGGSLDLQTLSEELRNRGFRLAGDRNFSLARARLKEMAGMALANIGNTIAGLHLPRLDAIAAVDSALESHRLIEIRGGPGVGKSGVLRHLAERHLRQSHVIVLDPVGTPDGGWIAYAQSIGVSATAKAFLSDLAASGGGVLFIDSLEMFAEPGRQRTVNDLLLEVSRIEGFTVIATARSEFGKDGETWLADDALAALGAGQTVSVGELQDAEVEMLSDHAPALRALLATGHPAAPIARNLYRLSRLLKVPSSATIRTEAALADYWWRTADGASADVVRAAQRILADLVDKSLTGGDALELKSDSTARSHLLRSLTLREGRRDHLGFYHDVLRDWAVACRIHEDRSHLTTLDLTAPVSPRIARGIEFAGRLSLEMQNGCDSWLEILTLLSPAGSHGSWRRQALLAIVRSELGLSLLDRCGVALLAQGGSLFRELCRAIVAVETVATADLLKSVDQGGTQPVVPRSLRTNTTGSAAVLLLWCASHSKNIPLQAIGAVIDLVEIQYVILMGSPTLAKSVAKMLFDWLLQLDVRDALRTIPSSKMAGNVDRQAGDRLVEDLRMWSLLLTVHAPDDAKAYLRAVAAEPGTHKVKAIRSFSSFLVHAAPSELAALIVGSLIEHKERESPNGRSRDREFSFADSDYLPPSPAQPPFFDLLQASPQIGLGLIRKLTLEAISHGSRGAGASADGFTLVFENGPRFFPWKQSYFWSRDQAREYSVASGLKALEAWGHARLDAGEPIDAVLPDILGPDGSCAAYLLVAVDLLISHWPASREALVPFMACPELLATEHSRHSLDLMDDGSFSGREPSGKVLLADLAARPSRSIPLANMVVGCLADDALANRLRTQLKAAVDALGRFDERANFSDPAFMGAYVLNMLHPENWVAAERGRAYRSPLAKAEHLERLSKRSDQLVRSSEVEAKINLAIGDAARASPEVAREAADYAAGELPGDSDTGASKMRSTQLVATAMLIARDGDEILLDTQEHWVRSAIDRALAESVDGGAGSGDKLRYNRPALAICALVHLWLRKRTPGDRETLIASAARRDRSAPTAFAAALDAILADDPRLLKAAVRAAFASCTYRWRPSNEDASAQARFEHEKAAKDARAAAAEMEWLDGGPEPEWPAFPDECRGIAPLADDELTDPLVDSVTGDATIRTDSQLAARWLRLLTGKAGSAIEWRGEIVDAYATWSAEVNGHGLPPATEIEGRKHEWNEQFYALLGIAMMDMTPPRFAEQLRLVTGLPDKSFGDVAEPLIHAADVLYFNDPQRNSERAVELRTLLTQRTLALRRWTWSRRPGDLSIDRETARIVAKVLMNTHDSFAGTQSYLVQGVFDRVDPLLDVLRPLLPGGPTAFIARCTMNMLLVAPRARHIDFLLSGVEAWLKHLPTDQAMWVTLGIGRKVIGWFEKAIIDEPGLLGLEHPHHDRIDAALGRLVDLGVPEAHEMEKLVEYARGP
ncbi:hypothetical protein B6S44_19535 [Bosea sp. Tri-44]|uniref:ATP-binding protein n=1 Tax=Bosea sp. Tri-44 TaxID=1972137 RepID=UPI00100DDF0B|nr:ATP-binding protein [Bosea sp. Tri-44]RXT52934.1 hypothetical protein B6S44_19535 [Bosea sp. Tri-44]